MAPNDPNPNKPTVIQQATDPLTMQLQAAKRRVVTVDDYKDRDVIYNNLDLKKVLGETVGDMPVVFHWLSRARFDGNWERHPKQDWLQPVHKEYFPNAPSDFWNHTGQFHVSGSDILCFGDARLDERFTNDERKKLVPAHEAINGQRRPTKDTPGLGEEDLSSAEMGGLVTGVIGASMGQLTSI